MYGIVGGGKCLDAFVGDASMTSYVIVNEELREWALFIYSTVKVWDLHANIIARLNSCSHQG